jgi:hypothetical protein
VLTVGLKRLKTKEGRQTSFKSKQTPSTGYTCTSLENYVKSNRQAVESQPNTTEKDGSDCVGFSIP